MFKTRLLIRFHHADRARVMFYGNLYLLAHQVLERFVVEAVGLGWDEFFANPEWTAPFRRVEADYFRPHPPGREVEATLAIVSLGETSLTMRIDFHDLDGEHLSRLVAVNVFTDADATGKIPMPASIRAQLTPFVEEDSDA